MATRKTTPNGNGVSDAKAPGGKSVPVSDKGASTRSGPIAAAGVQTGEDFANLMSALMSDLIDGSISPNVANATVNAGGKLLKVVEMQYRYGSPKESKPMSLTLAPGR